MFRDIQQAALLLFAQLASHLDFPIDVKQKFGLD